jgi:hypothetical protein
VNGLIRVGGVVVISGTAARTLCEAVLIAERARRSNGYPVSRDYATLAAELHAAASAAGQSDVRSVPDHDADVVQPTVPIEQAAEELGLSNRQTRRLAPDLGGRIIAGRWFIDRAALNEHIEGQHGSR